MSKRRRSRLVGIIIGPVITCLALMAIWKNETRFDFSRAAARTQPIRTPEDAAEEQRISHTGPMDGGLTIDGQYVQSFTGYLMVRRSAEVYAWDEHEDSDGDVTWSLKWMSSVESNSRNLGMRKQLTSKTLLPREYQVGALSVASEKIEFVESTRTIGPTSLVVTGVELHPEGEYLYLRKHQPQRFGDERLRYTGIPVPARATYFGKFESGRGVADTTHQRSGFVNQMILNSGILHHLVAGDRGTALAAMKAYIGRLKWLVRGIASAAVVIGLLIFFSTATGALLHIPVLGALAQAGSVLLALMIGIPLALFTMALSYLLANPLLLFAMVATLGGVTWFWRNRAKRSRQAVQQQLHTQYGHALNDDELKRQEFFELVQMALYDGELRAGEAKFLRQWSKKHGWSESLHNKLLSEGKQLKRNVNDQVADEVHLTNLVRLALADNQVSRYEIKTIRTVGRTLGYDDRKIRKVIEKVQQTAWAAANT